MDRPENASTGPAAEVEDEKARLRARFRAYRASLDDDRYHALAAAISERARGLPELERADCVHLYWPIVGRREVDTRPLIAWLHAQKKQIILPVVVNFGKASSGTPRLRHARYTPDHALVENRWGIHEPLATETVPIGAADAVVVPALGVGRDGHRIGHGHGYYDEMLADSGAVRIGLVYAACLVAHVPHETHDQPLDVIVTEHEVLRPGVL